MRWVLLIAALLAPTFASLAYATDGLTLLSKIATAAHNLNYTGAFVYRRAGHEETSHIAHVLVDGQEIERIVVLDGSPREVVRHGQQVRCFLPEEDLLIIEDQSRQKRFPALLPAGLSDLARHYSVKPGSKARVAGIDAQTILLEPKDAMRYAHELWMDPISGLLLKSTLLSERGQVLESFSFTQVNIGGSVDPVALKPRYESRAYKVQKVRSDEMRADDLAWSFKDIPSGFRKINAMRRKNPNKEQESLQVVFSDGLAAISIFIEPSAANESDTGTESFGPMHVYRRKAGDFRYIVIGEVPAEAVRRLGDGIERKPR
jgi:sigma-E factor negative regulatory protein RseB